MTWSDNGYGFIGRLSVQMGVPIILAAVGYGMLQTQVESLQNRDSEARTERRANARKITDIRVDVAVIRQQVENRDAEHRRRLPFGPDESLGLPLEEELSGGGSGANEGDLLARERLP